jgi:hypothetical protein
MTPRRLPVACETDRPRGAKALPSEYLRSDYPRLNHVFRHVSVRVASAYAGDLEHAAIFADAYNRAARVQDALVGFWLDVMRGPSSC